MWRFLDTSAIHQHFLRQEVGTISIFPWIWADISGFLLLVEDAGSKDMWFPRP